MRSSKGEHGPVLIDFLLHINGDMSQRVMTVIEGMVPAVEVYSIDEAFADPEPDNTIVALAGSDEAPNLIVLRSLGKFFGLAGARVGFMFGAADKRERLREMLGPWPVSHPARVVARHALADRPWQAATRLRLQADSERLAAMLAPLGTVRRTALFCTLSVSDDGLALFEHFARRAILLRRFAAQGLLRFGLPGSEAEWQRLGAAICAWSA